MLVNLNHLILDHAIISKIVNENLPKQGLNGGKAKLVRQVQEKEDVQKLKLFKMYRSRMSCISYSC